MNLTSVLQQSSLSPAAEVRCRAGGGARGAFARAGGGHCAAAGDGSSPAAVAADAQAAAALMAMNNVYYRFRHMVGKPEYEQLPPRLRMQRLARRPETRSTSNCSRWRSAP
jgi:alkyl hydroperoxide reductase subunit D